MSATRPRFSFLVYSYLTIFFVQLGIAPVFLLAIESLGIVAWMASISWLATIAALAAYVLRRLSSDRMTFKEGLLWVTASMMTGWTYLSFIVVLPALLFVFSASV